MPKNPLLKYGLLVVAAAALIFAGYWVTTNIVYFVPIAFGIGSLLIILGLVQESKKKKDANPAPTETPPV
jgi:hypothetical protein